MKGNVASSTQSTIHIILYSNIIEITTLLSVEHASSTGPA